MYATDILRTQVDPSLWSSQMMLWMHPFFGIATFIKNPTEFVVQVSMLAHQTQDVAQVNKLLNSNDELRDFYEDPAELEKLARYLVNFTHFLVTTRRPAIIIAEEKIISKRQRFTQKDTLELIRKIGYTGEVLLYETDVAMPTPALTHVGHASSLSQYEKFLPLTYTLQHNGVRQLLLGGGYFYSDQYNWLSSQLNRRKVVRAGEKHIDWSEPEGCINYFVWMMLKQLTLQEPLQKIVVSEITY